MILAHHSRPVAKYIAGGVLEDSRILAKRAARLHGGIVVAAPMARGDRKLLFVGGMSRAEEGEKIYYEVNEQRGKDCDVKPDIAVKADAEVSEDLAERYNRRAVCDCLLYTSDAADE